MKVDALYAEFSDPSKAYRVTPLLRINDSVEESQLRSQITSLKKLGFGGVFLICEHFGEASPDRFITKWWWEVVDTVARLCADVGLDFWVYDDEDWPSGSIGGQLTEANPEYQWKYLHRQEVHVQGHELAKLEFRATSRTIRRFRQRPTSSTRCRLMSMKCSRASRITALRNWLASLCRSPSCMRPMTSSFGRNMRPIWPPPFPVPRW